MKVQIGDKYVDKDGGIIRTVTKVFVAKEGNSEYIVFDTNENYALPLCQVNRLCTKIVQSEPQSDDAKADAAALQKFLAAAKAEYPTAKWIAKDVSTSIFVYFKKPCLGEFGSWEDFGRYLSPEDFSGVYTYFADIPFDESLTAI